MKTEKIVDYSIFATGLGILITSLFITNSLLFSILGLVAIYFSEVIADFIKIEKHTMEMKQIQKEIDKLKAMSKEEKEEHRKEHPLSVPLDFDAERKERKKQKKWNKKHPILATIKEIRDTLVRVLWYRLSDYPNDIKLWIRTKYQRAKSGWAISDAWGFDWYLARVIKEGCKWLKENKHGIPCGCFPNVQAIKTGDDSGSFKKAEETWNKILDKIIKTFETAQKIQGKHWNYQSSKKYDIKFANKIRRINKKMREEDPDLWDEDALHVMTKKECRAYEEGWRLFQENFFSLWD